MAVRFGMMRARMAGVLVATIVLVGTAGAIAIASPAGAAPYQLDGIGASCVEPGGSNTVHGNGFSADADVDVLVGTEQVATLAADSSGVVDGSFTVPSSFPTGATTVKLVGPSARGERTLSFDMTVGCTGPNAGGETASNGSGSGSLAFTGGSVGMTVGIAAALIIVGVAVLSARRRRKSVS